MTPKAKQRNRNNTLFLKEFTSKTRDVYKKCKSQIDINRNIKPWMLCRGTISITSGESCIMAG